MEQRCDNIEEKNYETSSEVYELRQRVEKLEVDLADQTDCGLRNHLSVHNIPLTKPRESWDETKAVLDEFLKKNVSADTD